MPRQEITIQQLNSAKNSLRGRRTRLKKTAATRFNGWTNGESPISAIDAFQSEINRVDDSYRRMQNALDNARITVEIEI